MKQTKQVQNTRVDWEEGREGKRISQQVAWKSYARYEPAAVPERLNVMTECWSQF